MHGAFASGRVERPAITAYTCGLWLDDALYGTGCDRRIDGISARTQDIQGRERREWVRGGHHRIGTQGRGASRQVKVAHGGFSLALFSLVDAVL